MTEHAVMNGIRGEISLNEPLSGYTSWRVGGPADRLFKPVDLDDLSAYMSQLPANEPVTWIGLGSNLLVRDGIIHPAKISPIKIKVFPEFYNFSYFFKMRDLIRADCK